MIFNLISMIILPIIFSEAFDCNFKLDKTSETIDFSMNSTIILSCVPIFSDNVELCIAPVPMAWSHNSAPVIEMDNRRKIVSSSNELIIFYAQRSDEGIYVCDTENIDGQINTTFTLQLTASSEFQASIVKDLLPHSAAEEKKGRIYWLPDMLINSVQQNYLVNPGEDKVFYGAYYITAFDTDLVEVEWFFQYEGQSERNIIKDDRYKNNLLEKPCNFHKLIPRKVDGRCYFNRLFIPKVNAANQGFYYSVFRLKFRTNAYLNVTYSLRMNVGTMAEPERDAFMIFNLDSKVCANDYFDFKCKMTSINNFYVAIKKVTHNGTLIKVAESTMESITFLNGTIVLGNGSIIQFSEINYRISPVTFSDAGSYLCIGYPVTHMTITERKFSEKTSFMELEVIPCSFASIKERLASSWSSILFWPLIATSVITILLALVIYLYHYYTTSCLIKTVIIQHPNKLYVPHDTSSPLLLPQVSIRTNHRFRQHHNRSNQNNFSSVSGIPFSQKLSKYFQKSCIFNYRRVNTSGSSPVVETIRLSDVNSSKSSSNSTKEDKQSQELIVENNSKIQYKLPANIGWVFSRDSLIIGSKIGEGAFGIVYEGIAKILDLGSVSVEVAIKTLHDSFGDEDLINLVKEMEMLKLIGHHRHIIALYGAYVDNGHPYIVMELAKNGNLRDFLRSQRSQMNVLQPQECLGMKVSTLKIIDLLRFGKEIAAGMEYLSSRMIIHRDLAARNILVDQYFEMKIADFGLTRVVENYYRKSTDGRLPIKWMAPECLLDRVYTVKSDVWSFGIVLWEIFTMGQTPYPTIQPDSMHQALRNGVRNERPDLASDEIYNFMLNIWNDDPVERPSFSEVITKMSELQVHQVMLSSRVDSESAPSHTEQPSQDTLVKDYLELNCTQCYSTTTV